MTTCANCHTKWSWKQTVKNTMSFDPTMTCPYCKVKQYQSQKSKTKGTIFTCIVIFLLFFMQYIFPLSIIGVLSLWVILFAVIMLVYPYLVELSSREEYPNFFRNK